MNAGTTRGRADGFTIEALAQMRTVKASKPGGPGQVMTLVDYIVQQLERSRPGELEDLFAENGEAQTVRKAARHKLADLNVELSAYCALADGLVKRTASTQDDELDIRGLRAESRLQQLGTLQKLYEQAEDEYRQLCTWFHEGSVQKRERPSDEFFALWDGFLEAVRVSIETINGKSARWKKTTDCRRPLQKLRSMSDVSTSLPTITCDDEAASGQVTPKELSTIGDASDGSDDGKETKRRLLDRRGTAPAILG